MSGPRAAGLLADCEEKAGRNRAGGTQSGEDKAGFQQPSEKALGKDPAVAPKGAGGVLMGLAARPQQSAFHEGPSLCAMQGKRGHLFSQEDAWARRGLGNGHSSSQH